MKKIATMSVFAILLLSSAIAVSEPATEPSARLEDPLIPQPIPDMIKIWEAYAKGWAQITTEVNPYGNPSVFRVTNSGTFKININEMIMLLSPYPLESWNPQTTQDGALTSAVVDPYSYLEYEYGDGAPPGSTVWWCTEH
ncbi:MAG: hypothetical protein V3V91_02435, partial [Thermoplasmata archaeon]